jgi:hypothetical protein
MDQFDLVILCVLSGFVLLALSDAAIPLLWRDLRCKFLRGGEGPRLDGPVAPAVRSPREFKRPQAPADTSSSPSALAGTAQVPQTTPVGVGQLPVSDRHHMVQGHSGAREARADLPSSL